MNKKMFSVIAGVAALLLVGAGCNNGLSTTTSVTPDSTEATVDSSSSAGATSSARAEDSENKEEKDTESNDDGVVATTAINASASSSSGAGAAMAATGSVRVVVPPVVVVATAKEFTITAKDWEFSPRTITVKKGDKVRLKISSVDVDHGFALADFNVNVTLRPGQTQVVEFVADKVGTFSFRCNVPCGEGHREMTGTLVVQ